MTQSCPHTCVEWITVFERFGYGDDATLAEMRRGTLELASREHVRWQSALTGALRQRLTGLSAQVGERLDLALAAGDVSTVLGWTRAQLVSLYYFSRVPAFPDAVRLRIERSCRRWLEQTQVRLERGTTRTPDQELVLLTIRRSSLRWPPITSKC